MKKINYLTIRAIRFTPEQVSELYKSMRSKDSIWDYTQDEFIVYLQDYDIEDIAQDEDEAMALFKHFNLECKSA
jgi:hypothetical protein